MGTPNYIKVLLRKGPWCHSQHQHPSHSSNLLHSLYLNIFYLFYLFYLSFHCDTLIPHLFSLFHWRHLKMDGMWWEGTWHHPRPYLQCPINQNKVPQNCKGTVWCSHWDSSKSKSSNCILHLLATLCLHLGWNFTHLQPYHLHLNTGNLACQNEVQYWSKSTCLYPSTVAQKTVRMFDCFALNHPNSNNP